jgi:hypothetical protein
MIKTHVASKGASAGKYVKCPARIHCRVATPMEHITFYDEDAINEFNMMNSELARSLINDMPPTDETRKKIDAINRDMNELASGRSLNHDDVNSHIADIMQYNDTLWGSGSGMSESAPRLDDKNVELSGSWKRTGSNHHSFLNPYGRGSEEYTSYGDGSTSLTISDQSGFDNDQGEYKTRNIKIRFEDSTNSVIDYSKDFNDNDNTPEVKLSTTKAIHYTMNNLLSSLSSESKKHADVLINDYGVDVADAAGHWKHYHDDEFAKTYPNSSSFLYALRQYKMFR